MEPQRPYSAPQQNIQGGPPPPHWPQPSQKKSKLGWILGSIGVAAALVGVLLFVGYPALVNAINGGGKSHDEKVHAMIATADNVPEADWVLLDRSDPKLEAECLASDAPCLRLNATWSVDHRVGLSDVASRLGIDMSGAPPSGRYIGCMQDEPSGGVGIVNLCIDEAPDAEESYLVAVILREK
jgi:hypothetical protein